MSNYVKITDFAAKDALLTGNPLKVAKGTEIGAEFDNIATAIATKLDTSSLLSTLLTVDGSGSGIDADLIDGKNIATAAQLRSGSTNIVGGDILHQYLYAASFNNLGGTPAYISSTLNLSGLMSTSRTGAGQYTFTHNWATSSYIVQVSHVGTASGTQPSVSYVYSKGTNSFSVQCNVWSSGSSVWAGADPSELHIYILRMA